MSIHIAPTKSRQKNSKGGITIFILQGKVRIFVKNNSHICSACRYEPDNEKDVWIYH